MNMPLVSGLELFEALREAGCASVERLDLCTACDADRFFSYRRDGKPRGGHGVLQRVIGTYHDAGEVLLDGDPAGRGLVLDHAAQSSSCPGRRVGPRLRS